MIACHNIKKTPYIAEIDSLLFLRASISCHVVFCYHQLKSPILGSRLMFHLNLFPPKPLHEMLCIAKAHTLERPNVSLGM